MEHPNPIHNPFLIGAIPLAMIIALFLFDLGRIQEGLCGNRHRRLPVLGV